MIDFYFGKPRSGKSYRAMKLIFDLYIVVLIKDETPKYRNILTNIGGFNFKKVNQIFTDKGSSSVAYKLVWKDFYIYLKKLYDMALDDKSDEELNRYCDYHKINDCLIILDEASLYMKKYDDVISWWLAYHGHFKIRIVVIAQSPKQIHAEYMSHTEIFYEAQPQAKQLRDNQLRYLHYSDIPFNKDSKFSSDTIKTSQDIYDLYKSGEVDKPKKIIYKFIGIAILGLVAIVFFYNLLISNMTSRSNVDDEDFPVNTEQTQSFKDNSIVDSFSLINIRCNDMWCWNGNNKYEDNTVSLNYFKNLVIKHKIELFFDETKAEIYSLVPFEKTLSKKTLSKLIDYYYLIPVDIKNKYLASLFIPRKIEKLDRSLLKNNSENIIPTIESEAVREE